MTQSKKTDFESTIIIDDIIDPKVRLIDNSDDTITINLDNTYGATTSYSADMLEHTITIDSLDTHAIDWTANTILGDTRISPQEIERMCEHYPGLEKVWRNFKSVYDMCKQDYEGKKKAGEIDDDIPF